MKADNQKRNQKWYRKNEAEQMQKLGLKVTSGSGAGWVEKEDGENEFVLAQHKATDAVSFKLSLLDMKTLEHNAMVAHKIPLFLVQFLSEDKTYAIVDVMDLPSIATVLETEYQSTIDLSMPARTGKMKAVLEESEVAQRNTHIQVKSGGRADFYKQKEKEMAKSGKRNNSKSFL